jgi:translation initiation factor IF-2
MLTTHRPVATVLIVRGCLTTASHVIAGTCHGKVRVMTDSAGASVKAAYPGMAVAVSGWRELPNAGDEVLTGSEADVKKAFANRQRKAEVDASLVDMEAINTQRMEERRKEEDKEEGATDEVQADEYRPKELRLVIKGDVSGSVEAIEGALQGIGNKDVIVKIVSTGVGDVSESDVMMAQTAEGLFYLVQ